MEWFCLVAGVGLVLHYAWLMDDAYIYFRYVDNWLLLGHGLVFNRGEFVEGYSSPLWVLTLGGLRAIGLEYWTIVRGVGVASFLCFFGLLVAVNRALSPPGSRSLGFPVIFLSLHYAVACYFTSGTESPLVLIAAACYGLFFLRPQSRALQVALAFTPLLRHELALPFLVALVWGGWRRGRPPWTMALVCGANLTAWLLFRVYYYAELLPNPFYLKNLVSIQQGLLYLHDALVPYHLYAVFALAAGALLALRLSGAKASGVSPDRAPSLRLAERGAMLAAAILVAGYVVKIGGDARHFRYLAFPITLALCATGGIAECALRAAGLTPSRRTLAIAAAALALLSFSSYPRQLAQHPIFGAPDGAVALVDKISDAAHHRQHPRLPRLSGWGSGSAIEQTDRYASARAAQGRAPDYGGLLVEHLCFRFYRDFDRHGIHALGLTEPILARTTPKRSARPAHSWKLRALADDLAEVHRWSATAPAPGMYREAVLAGQAAPWIAANLGPIEHIERKIYNRHDWAENFALAFASSEPIRLGDSAKRRPRRRGKAKAGDETAPPAARPDVLLVTIDTLRADRLGAYGYDKPTSPHFDRLAASGALFELAYAPMGATSPAHATLFTSRSPLAHGLVRNGFPLAADEVLLAERLRDAGYQTAGFVSAYPVGHQLGFARGFDHFDDDFSSDTGSFREGDDTNPETQWEGESFEGGFDRTGGATVDAALRWLSQRPPEPAKAVFMWVHLFDPHRPYLPSERWAALFSKPDQSRRERDSALYDAEIRGVDAELARLVEAFERRARDALLVVTADHGEGLWQHGYRAHGHTLYEEELRVPLLVRWPDRIPARRLRQPAQLIDVAPTLLGLLGLEADDRFDGSDLSAHLTGRTPPDSERPIFLLRPYYETARSKGAHPEAGLGLGVRRGRWKLIEMAQENRRELYDLVTDPGESHDLSERESRRVETLSALLAEWRLSEEQKSSGRKFEVSPEDRRAMGALGYSE